MTSYILTADDVRDGAVITYHGDTAYSAFIDGRTILLNVDLCVGCDQPFENGWCPRCEEWAEPLSELKTGTGGYWS